MSMKLPSCANAAYRKKSKSPQPRREVLYSDGPTRAVAVNISGPLSKTKQGLQYVLEISDQCSKLPCAVSLSKKTHAHVAILSLDYWIIRFRMPEYFSIGNVTQFGNKFFNSIGVYFGLKYLTYTAYRSQTNGQNTRYNRTIITRLRHYVGTVKGLGLVHTTTGIRVQQQIHNSSNISQYSFFLSHYQPWPSLLSATTIVTKANIIGTSSQALRNIILQHILVFLLSASPHLRNCIGRHKSD